MTEPPSAYNPVLDFIAKVLRVPVQRLLIDEAINPNEDALALLHAWMAIGNVQGQRRVVSFAQREAARSAQPYSLPPSNVVPLKPSDL